VSRTGANGGEVILLHDLLNGLTSLGSGQSLLFLFVGTMIGLFVGVIPGLGGAVVMSIVVAFAYKLSLAQVVCLFLAVQAGSYYSASITSILLNVPAHPEAFAVTLDGFPMAQRGQAGRALGISAVSTLLGGLLGCVALVGLLQVIDQLATGIHPPEFVALIALALILVGTLGTDAVGKGVISAGLGIVIASVGSSYITGVTRYTFNSVDLESGVDLVALVLGALAIPQMILMFGTGTRIARQDMMGRELAATAPAELDGNFRRQSLLGGAEVLRHVVPLIRAAVVGVITGVVPGIGGFTANFLSYGIAQQSSKNRKLFGTGIPEGVIAAEGSSLAKEAGHLVPLLGLGIPGGVGGALFLAALSIKNIDLGYGFTKQYPTLTYEMVWIIALAGVVGTLVGLLITPWLAQVTRIPGLCVVPFVMALAVIGTFAAEVSLFVVAEMIVFVVVGFVLRRLRYSLPALVIGLVLGTTFENNVYLTLQVYPGFSFLAKQPVADVLFAIAIAVLVLRAIQERRASKQASQAREELAEGGQSAITAAEAAAHPYPLLGAVTSVALLCLGVGVVVYGIANYDLATLLMPAIGGSAVAVGALWRSVLEIRWYLRYRRRKRARLAAEVALTELSAVTVAGAGQLVSAEAEVTVTVTTTAERSSRLPGITEKTWGLNGQYTREVIGLAWFAGLIIVCYLFGFNVGVPVFMAVYGFIATRRVFTRWVGRVVFAACSAAVMWAVSYTIIVVLLNIQYSPLLTL
jgi:putative tricarboxylic transport membrane protein